MIDPLVLARKIDLVKQQRQLMKEQFQARKAKEMELEDEKLTYFKRQNYRMSLEFEERVQRIKGNMHNSPFCNTNVRQKYQTRKFAILFVHSPKSKDYRQSKSIDI